MTEISFTITDYPQGVEAVLERAVAAALAHEGIEGEVALLVTDDAGIRQMNRDFRDIDRATDVLSFPAGEQGNGAFLGDIAISFERAAAQAAEYGHCLERELSFLAVHGTLHLMGYDHMEEAERLAMFAIQEKILEEMGMRR